MNTLKMKMMERLMVFLDGLGLVLREYQEHVLFLGLIGLWLLMPHLQGGDVALVTDGLWQLVLLGLICFLMLTGLCWWLLKRFIVVAGLPGLGFMVLQFKDLKVWHQFAFYLVCFALLLLAGVGCLVAVI